MSLKNLNTTKSKIESFNNRGISFLTILNAFLAIALIFSLGVRVYYADKASTAGTGLGEIESQIAQYEKENEYLTNEYLSVTSLSVIKPLALENGYIDAKIDYYAMPGLASR